MSSLLMSVLLLAPPAPEEAREEAAAFVLPGDQRYASHLDAIRAHASKKDWAVTTTLIQKLLDLDEDVFVSLRRNDNSVTVSLRTEANRLLLDLPAEGRTYYQQEYGPKADDLLIQGRMLKDERMLALTVRRFLHTEAGLEACERLALHLLAAGRSNAAAVHFKHVLERIPPEKMTAATLQKAALAFGRSGDGPRFDLVWRALAMKPGVKIAEVRKEIEQQSVVQSRARKDWPAFRGDPSRNASAAAGVPVLEPIWKTDLSEEKAGNEKVLASCKALLAMDRPVLPAQQPLTLALPRDTGVFALSLHRSFWGQHARALHRDDGEEVKAGEVFWEAPSVWSLDRMMKEPRHVGVLVSSLSQYIEQKTHPGILFENTAYGTMSTDGRHAFMIEDFQVPPDRSWFEQRKSGGDRLSEALRGNCLQAYEESGKLIWELGGRDLFANSFFLSAPLVLDGKLHVLNEKDGAIRLMKLEPTTGAVLSQRTLVTVRDKRPTSINRQLDAAHLAYSEGILICPTNAGVVIGVEAETGKTLWTFAYETRSPKQPEKAERWRYPAPIIHRGRVILAPPDSPAIYCLDLHDGSLAWTQAAQQGDLYVGGVISDRVLIVGAKACRAIDVTNGKKAWNLATGTPSGLGIASGEFYLLPLSAEILTAVPEICLLHVGQGSVAAHVLARNKDEVPGNLAYIDGYLLSQTATSLALYPLHANQAKLIENLTKKDPNDPEVIARRGIVKQNEGNLGGALADYRTAVANGATPEMRNYLRVRLNEATQELYRNDLTTLAGLRELFENASWVLGDSREAVDFRSRCWAQSLFLAGRIQEQRKHPVAAAEWYLALANCSEAELLTSPDDPGLSFSPNTGARARLRTLLRTATEEERKHLDNVLRFHLEKALADLKFTSWHLRGVIAVVEADHEVGRAARLKLVELLNLQKDFLEIEGLLLDIRRQSADRVAAALALEKLALLSLQRGLVEDGAAWFRELARYFADVKLRNGKTGKELFGEALADRRYSPFLTMEEFPPRCGSFKVSKVQAPPNESHVSVPQDGNGLPFFRRQRFELSKDDIRMVDQRSGEKAWSWYLFADGIPEMVRLARSRSSPFFRYSAFDHLAIVTLGPYILAVDPIGKEILWNRNLLGKWTTSSEYRGHKFRPDDGSLLIHYHDWTQVLPRGGLVSPSAIVLLTRDAMLGVEPLTGKLMWRRPVPRTTSTIFHDAEHLFIIDRDGEGEATNTRVLSMRDGTIVEAEMFTPLLKNRLIGSHGGTLLLAERDAFARLTLRQYDVLARKDRWRRTFLPGSLVMQTEEPLTGVVQPDGTVFVFDLESGKEVLKVGIKPEHLKKVESVLLMRDVTGFYLACRRPRSENIASIMSHITTGSGLQSTEINGWLYCFNTDGQSRWTTEVEDKTLVVSHFRSMPIFLLSTRMVKRADPGKPVEGVVQTLILDKGTGKPLFDAIVSSTRAPWIQAINADERTSVVEVIRDGSKLRIEPGK